MPDGDAMEFKPAKIRQGIHTTADSNIEYQADILPAGKVEHDLSLLNFDTEDAAKRHPQLARTLSEFAIRIGAKRLYAPKLRFTRTILEPRQFGICIELPGGIPLFRSENAADGVLLPEPGDAMIGSFGGCSHIALVYKRTLIAAHGGLDGLVHRAYVTKDAGADERSIVDAMCRIALPGTRLGNWAASCRAFFSVPRKSYFFDFYDPKFAVYNRALHNLLVARYDAEKQEIVVMDEVGRGFYLDQGRLIGAQARKHGVKTVSTCLEPLRTPECAHTRHRDETMRNKRNLTAITRLR